MTSFKRLAIALPILLFLAVAGCRTQSNKDGFLHVTGPCNLSFPADHGPHPGYRTEWWYYTGHLSDSHRHRFGFQLTFFRNRLKPPADRQSWPHPSSAWRTDQLYLAHAALTDITGGRHLQAERIARPVLSLAGAEPTKDGWRIYLHSWQAVITPFRHLLRADTRDFNFKLTLTPSKPPALHGNAGYSRKGQTPERASCYYSFTRLQAAGTLMLDGASHHVDGSAWMDHEFSTAPLQPGIAGWDWFALQFSDDTEIMFYLLRNADGTVNAASSGTYVLPSGKTRHLRRDEVRITALAYWTSPHTDARYPVKWALVIASLNCKLTVTADLVDQEMRTPRSTNVVYWEGSVKIAGIKAKKRIQGVGYVELTGYAKPFNAPM
jgi:predicted secreted hydrolase